MTNAISFKEVNIVTKSLRAAFINPLGKTNENHHGKTQHSMMMLIAKDDEETLGKIELATKAAIYKMWKDDVPDFIDMPLKDGDGPKNAKGESYPGYCQNCYLLNVSSPTPPDVVDMKKQPITDPDELTFEFLYRVNIRAYAVANNDKNAVYFALNAVQRSDKTARRRASDVFTTDE